MCVCKQLLTHVIVVRVLRDIGLGEGIALTHVILVRVLRDITGFDWVKEWRFEQSSVCLRQRRSDLTLEMATMNHLQSHWEFNLV